MSMIRFVLLCMCGVLGGCAPSSPSPEGTQEAGKVKILSTTSMIDDLIGRVGGERVEHKVLITGEIDPHSYELVKGDGEKFGVADVVFYSGLGLEHGASVQEQLRTHPHAVALGDYIVGHHPGKEIADRGKRDPHIWMDISLWSEAIDPIVQALKERDPEGSAIYEKNAAALKENMRQVHEALYKRLQAIPEGKRYLVTSHDAFNYFTRAYLASPEEVKGEAWKERFAAPEGLAPEGQLSVADIQRVIEHLRLHQINVLFPESNVSRDSLKKIVSASARKGIVVRLCKDVLYGDAMGPKGSAAFTYLGMMEHNASVLEKEWE